MMLRKWYSGDILDFSVRVVVSDVRHFKRCDKFPPSDRSYLLKLRISVSVL